MSRSHVSRRSLLRAVALGGLGLGLPDVLDLRPQSQAGGARLPGFGRAKACIVLYSWGGMSQLETWDPKPEAPREVRGEYESIATAVPGIRIGEWMPRLARQTSRLAIVRSMSHKAQDHRQAAYLNFTGRLPLGFNGMMVADPVAPTREDAPCLGAMISKVSPPAKGLPGSVVLPYTLAERGPVAGQNGGFLGPAFDPVAVRPALGTLFQGVSPSSELPKAALADGLDLRRVRERERLLSVFDEHAGAWSSQPQVASYQWFEQAALEIVASDRFAKALDVSLEQETLRKSYGTHICGQSALLARRLTEAGVPLVTVYCSVGDLNGSFGASWDHHFQIYPRLKSQMLPPLDEASAALLDDLSARGTLDETLVIWLTEFGRSPLLNKTEGRDHWANCYSIALAGAGIAGGAVYGRSDRHAGQPAEDPCSPEDVQATILHFLGIEPSQAITTPSGRRHILTPGRPLPLALS